MPFTVLTDANVREVINSLTREDVKSLHKSLADALHSYSTATDPEDSGCCAANQPSRISIKGKTGLTTLYMPATSNNGMGVKVVTLAAPKVNTTRNHEDEDSIQASPAPSSRSSMAEAVSKSSSRASSPSTTRLAGPSSPKAHTPTAKSTKPTDSPDDPATPKGSITLLTPDGRPRAILNASTLTAFRTALASTMLFKLRSSVHTLVVFGAGAQAYWHIYLALLLRGPEIHHLYIINRTFTRGQEMAKAFASATPNAAVSEAWHGGKLNASVLTHDYGEYSRLLKEYVRAADVMFCCTPSTTPLFPAAHLTNPDGRRKGRYIAAIGSYQSHMQEIPVEVLRQAVAPPGREHQHRHLHLQHKQAGEGGAVVVDTIEGAMKEAGELIKAGIGGEGVVELGELVMLRRSGKVAVVEEKEKRRSISRDRLARGKSSERALRSKSKEKRGDHDGGLMDWLERGNVIYKSVGMGLMDVVVGMDIVRLAEERGIGTTVHDF